MNEVQIREMKPEDLESVLKLIGEHYDPRLADRGFFNKQWKSFVAVDGGEIVGHGGLKQSWLVDNAVEFSHDVVRTDKRGEGISSRLYEARMKYLADLLTSPTDPNFEKLANSDYILATAITKCPATERTYKNAVPVALLPEIVEGESLLMLTEKLPGKEDLDVSEEFVYVPKQHKAFIDNVYDSLGCKRKVVSVVPNDEKMKAGYGHERLWEMVDLSNPMAPEVIQAYENNGYFMCGVLPSVKTAFGNKADHAIMMFLGDVKVNPEAIKVTENSEHIKEYVLKQLNR